MYRVLVTRAATRKLNVPMTDYNDTCKPEACFTPDSLLFYSLHLPESTVYALTGRVSIH